MSFKQPTDSSEISLGDLVEKLGIEEISEAEIEAEISDLEQRICLRHNVQKEDIISSINQKLLPEDELIKSWLEARSLLGK